MGGRNMTERKIVVKKGTYRDSITLMKISNTILGLTGVTQAGVVMATPLNIKFLADVGFRGGEIASATTDNLIIAIEAKDMATLDAAIEETESMLSTSAMPAPGGQPAARNLAEALTGMPDANLVVISVPGQYAKREAIQALGKNLNVFLFSSGVSRDDELELKTLAREKGLLMMGPDCGTSIINGKVLGFGNIIRPGSIGIVSASGTGLQEVTTLIHKAGLGVSQAIGTGGGDVSEQVGGITMIQGIELLEANVETKTIVLISKPPAQTTMEKILNTARHCAKPFVVNFLGGDLTADMLGELKSASTLEDAVRVACELAGKSPPASDTSPKNMVSLARTEYTKLAASQRYVRGLFSGGTLCYESQVILQPALGEVFSNAPVKPENRISGDAPSKKHSCIDMGAEEFVEGRMHPMMDFSIRNRRILQEARDPETAVLLIDVELGFGSNPDPAKELVPVIREARALANKEGRYLSVVASVIGTEGDFQDLVKQEKNLREAGVQIMPTSAQAAKLSALIASRGTVEATILGRQS
jgi:FdrA protein